LGWGTSRTYLSKKKKKLKNVDCHESTQKVNRKKKKKIKSQKLQKIWSFKKNVYLFQKEKDK